MLTDYDVYPYQLNQPMRAHQNQRCLTLSLPVTVKQLKAATQQDPVLSKLLLYTKSGWPSTIPDALQPYW